MKAAILVLALTLAPQVTQQSCWWDCGSQQQSWWDRQQQRDLQDRIERLEQQERSRRLWDTLDPPRSSTTSWDRYLPPCHAFWC